MVKRSCALHPLHRFKYWPVFSVFVLVPSAHTDVHGLFHSLVISPPAAWAENEVIIQQAVQGFPSARLHSAVCSRLRHSRGAELRGPASCCCGGILLTMLSCLNESGLGSQVREALKKHSTACSLVLADIFFEAGLLAVSTSLQLKRQGVVVSQ